jgi:diaminohydroxyphosphoribosylaminopyrimidine deaminase/5-amino-6-(5-phosphoribosylamino)uracil reductase
MNHELYMKMALEEARRGFPNTAPNPLVGCVIVHNDEVVASGFHQAFGAPHAEVNAVNALPKDVHPSSCTLYVTLEPCSHQGKTPPCADFLIERGIKKIVIAMQDPNPAVSGAGLKKLTGAGVEIVSGILEKEAKSINRPFVTFHEKKRPYIVIKWAITADGFISRIPYPKNREENFISRQDARVYTHKLRSELMSVLVGKKTVLADNPELTTRLVRGKNPIRMFIDRKLEIPKSFNVYDQQVNTLVFNEVKNDIDRNTRFIQLDFRADIVEQICNTLYELQVQSVLIEGGAALVNSFIEKDLWDEVLVFQNPDLCFGTGVKGPVFALKNTFEIVGNDKLFHHFHDERLPTSAMPKEIF